MRTLLSFLGVGVIAATLSPLAAATPLSLEYDVTIDHRCPQGGPCSAVSIGGLELTLTTDDTFYRRDTYPNEVRAHFGPTTLAIDTSALGDFANPFGVTNRFSSSSSYLYDVDSGVSQNTTVFLDDLRLEETILGDIRQQYMVYRWMGMGREGVPDGIPANFTSADVGLLLAQDLLFYHSVRAFTCIGSDPCTLDPRSFEVSGIATVREPLAPVPEPATGLLFGLGLAAIAATRRGRRSRVSGRT